ncbi:MAG: sensor histidine kinase [Candidatus Dormibacter sp.]|uniref:sensor histidine kinase n=1 Tax=Candidatus Dormibacter sp. TaxID=2973982 RepID=UPI000DB6C8C4|nr:MAG: hypothetical protein DLM66_09350 [Candidatus Dormibacteraeota bacterium]
MWSIYLAHPVAFTLYSLWFPNGRLASAKWWPARVYALAAAGALVGGTVVGAEPIGSHFTSIPGRLHNPTRLLEGDTADLSQAAGWALSMLAVLLGVIALIVRMRRATGRERAQVKLLITVVAVSAVGFVAHFFTKTLLPDSAPDVGVAVLKLGFVVGLPAVTAFAALYHGLFELNLAINRALVYGTLTVVVVVLYALAVGILGALFQLRGNFLVSVVATGLVAVAFAPLRTRLQRAVDRLMYGERDRPYEVLTAVGSRIGSAQPGDQVLVAVVETVTRVLRPPYAALRLEDDGHTTRTIESGEPVADQLAVTLEHQGERSGAMIFGQRGPRDRFSDPERRLLEDVARQAAAAVQASRLATDLLRSRERLVNAREEERRRLRRDLHDGLGPALGALILKLGSARALIARDPSEADRRLVGLERDAQAILADVRRLVYGLRPPALDDLGLVGAIRQSAAGFSNGALTVVVDAPEDLPALPAAVEVAALRIAQEAIANVARHAGARRCRVGLRVNGALRLEVADDGVGLEAGSRAGVGLTSIRERVAEIGGSLSIEAKTQQGTRLVAVLPHRS